MEATLHLLAKQAAGGIMDNSSIAWKVSVIRSAALG
jgi:hypothetical protein